MPELLRTALHGLPPPRRGKVREVYDLSEEVLIIATDRISAFDVVMENGIPDKGVILNRMSGFWFEHLSAICPNHVVSLDDEVIQERLQIREPEILGRSTLAKKAKPLAIECVARGFISGSLYKEYKLLGSNVHDLELPEGLLDSDRLPNVIFTPATKAEIGHDENLSRARAEDLVGKETLATVMKWTLELYRQAFDHCSARGIILADTKFEFGETDDGLILIDECLTPDSSRFWSAADYQPGRPQPSFDKQFVRDYLESIGWNKLPPGPRLPSEIVARTREKYIEAAERICGVSPL